MFAMAQASDYRKHADECTELAQTARTPSQRTMLLHIADTWLLASGYAEANPNKAFPLLETAILRANDTLSAFIKVAEFIDINDEIIDDGEIQVGMFGGSMMRELTGELGMADNTIKSLAKADFAKTVNLTDTFDRTEIRVLAKMLVLRSVMADHSKAEPGKDDIGG